MNIDGVTPIGWSEAESRSKTSQGRVGRAGHGDAGGSQQTSCTSEMVGAIDMMCTLLPDAKRLGLQSNQSLPSAGYSSASSSKPLPVTAFRLCCPSLEYATHDPFGRINVIFTPWSTAKSRIIRSNVSPTFGAPSGR